jgi:RNA polymerase sigma factor (sigma-70 family)
MTPIRANIYFLNPNQHHIISLIDRCLQKQQSAFYEFYHLFYKPMYNSSYRILKNAVDAEDVMQDSFMAAFTKLHTFKGMEIEDEIQIKLGAWLKRIVINNSINFLKKQNQYVFSDFEKDLPAEEAVDTDDFSKNEVQKVLTCIQRLKPKYAVALTLHLIEGYDYEEMSDIMHLSYQNIRTIVSRAKVKVAAEFELLSQN